MVEQLKKPSKPMKEWQKIGIVISTTLLILLIILALILDQIKLFRKFSSEIKSQKAVFTIKQETGEETIRVFFQPLLNALIISSDSLRLSSKTFRIEKTNLSTFSNQNINREYDLQVASQSSTYYKIQPKKEKTIPIYITIRPAKKETNLAFSCELAKPSKETLFTLTPPLGKIRLELTTGGIKLIIRDSNITYDSKKDKTNGREIFIEGEPFKLVVEADKSKNGEIITFLKKETEIKLINKTITLINNLVFEKAGEGTKIYIEEEEKPILINGNAPSGSNIKINGIITKILDFKIKGNEIYTQIEGKYKVIEIATKTYDHSLWNKILKWLKQKVLPLLPLFGK